MARRPKHYRPTAGDEFIELRNIGPEHVGRIFEARDQKTGEGIMGELEDVNHYQLHGTIAIRFRGEKLGLFEVPNALILLKPEGFVVPAPLDLDE